MAPKKVSALKAGVESSTALAVSDDVPSNAPSPTSTLSCAALVEELAAPVEEVLLGSLNFVDTLVLSVAFRRFFDFLRFFH